MTRRWTILAAGLGRRPRFWVLVAAIGVVAAAAGYWSWNSRNAEGQRRLALQALRDGDFEAAKAHFNAYLAVRPDDAEGHFLLARACRRSRIEDLDQAHRRLDEARRLGSPALDVALESAMLDVQKFGVSANQGETLAALRSYADSGGPGHELAPEALARGCLKENRLEEAKAWLNQWAEQGPDDWLAHLWRGAVFEYLNEPNHAIPDYEFVLNARPGDAEVKKRLGLMYAQSGYGYDKALSLLESYLRTDPGDADALVGVARCRRALGRSGAAEAVLRQVAAAHPDHLDALATLALVASDRGDDQEALAWLRRLEPLTRRNTNAEGLRRLRRLEPTPNNTDFLQRRRMVFNLAAAALGRLGRDEQARRCQAEAERLADGRRQIPALLREVEEKPHDAAALGKLGALYLAFGMEEEAKDAFGRALREKSDDPQASRGLAELRRRLEGAPSQDSDVPSFSPDPPGQE